MVNKIFFILVFLHLSFNASGGIVYSETAHKKILCHAAKVVCSALNSKVPNNKIHNSRISNGRISKVNTVKSKISYRDLTDKEKIKKLEKYCMTYKEKIKSIYRKNHKITSQNEKYKKDIWRLMINRVDFNSSEYKEELSSEKEKNKILGKHVEALKVINDRLYISNKNLEENIENQLLKNAQLEKQIEKSNQKIPQLESELKANQTKLSPPVYVGSSTIPNAGLGLFAGVNINEGTIIGEYTGRRVFRLKIPATNKFVVWGDKPDGTPEYLTSDSHTIWGVETDDPNKIEKGTDANYPEAKEDRTIFRFVNHSFNHNAIVHITGTKDRIWIQAFHAIREGEEIFWDYNDGNEKVFKDEVLPLPDHIHHNAEKYVKFDLKNKKVSIKEKYKVTDDTTEKTIWH